MSDVSDGQVAALIEGRLDAHAVETGASDPCSRGAIRAVVRAIERTWDLVIPTRLLDQVRDRGELVEACVARVRRHVRLQARRRPLPPAAAIKVRIDPPAGSSARGLTRSGMMTAYDAEELLDGARRWGPGAGIDLVVTGGRDAAMVEALADRISALGDGLVRVSIRRAGAS